LLVICHPVVRIDIAYSCTKSDDFRLSRYDIVIYFPKIKDGTWQWPRHFQGQFVVRKLGLAMINVHTKFEASSLRRCW